MIKTIVAYTDGSAVAHGKNEGLGGFGTYFPDYFGDLKAFSAGYKDTKTGRMEQIALLYAIKAMPLNRQKRLCLLVYSDSKFVVDSFNKGWIANWVNNGWKSSTGETKNKDIWKAILRELDKRPYLKFVIRHIKGHQYDKEKCPIKKKELLKDPHILGNTVADRLADYKRHSIYLECDKPK